VSTKTFTAVLHREEDMYVAECPEVGTVSQGATVEEALANLKEATELYLDYILRSFLFHQFIRQCLLHSRLQ